MEQAPEEGRVRFALLPGGSRLKPMRRFDGAWSVAGSEGHHDATLTLEQVWRWSLGCSSTAWA